MHVEVHRAPLSRRFEGRALRRDYRHQFVPGFDKRCSSFVLEAGGPERGGLPPPRGTSSHTLSKTTPPRGESGALRAGGGGGFRIFAARARRPLTGGGGVVAE